MSDIQVEVKVQRIIAQSGYKKNDNLFYSNSEIIIIDTLYFR